MSKKRKRMSGYKKSLIIFTIILLICGEFILIYVNSSLKAIYSHIKIYLDSLKKSKDKKKDDNNQNLIYQLKIDDLNQQIKDLKYEIELLGSKENSNIDDGSPKKFKIYSYLKKKEFKIGK
jgi:lipopolysaccharide export LptBFGC system permease protein LptF